MFAFRHALDKMDDVLNEQPTQCFVSSSKDEETNPKSSLTDCVDEGKKQKEDQTCLEVSECNCQAKSEDETNDDGFVVVKNGRNSDVLENEREGVQDEINKGTNESDDVKIFSSYRSDGFPAHNQLENNEHNVTEVTSDFGDEYDESEEESNEHEHFIASIYSCPTCGWKPHMEKCSVHRAFQSGFSNGVYQYQGIMPSQAQGYANYTYFHGYAAGQRPMYPPAQTQQTTGRAAVDMRYNPTTNQVAAVPVSANIQVKEEKLIRDLAVLSMTFNSLGTSP